MMSNENDTLSTPEDVVSSSLSSYSTRTKSTKDQTHHAATGTGTGTGTAMRRRMPQTQKRQKAQDMEQIIYNEILTSLCIELAHGVHRMAKTGVIPLSDIMNPSRDTNYTDEKDEADDPSSSKRSRGPDSSDCNTDDNINDNNKDDADERNDGTKDQDPIINSEKEAKKQRMTIDDDYGATFSKTDTTNNLESTSEDINTTSTDHDVKTTPSASLDKNDNGDIAISTGERIADQVQKTQASSSSLVLTAPTTRTSSRSSTSNSTSNNINNNTLTSSSSSSVLDVWGKTVPKEPRRTTRCSHCGKTMSALRFAQHLDRCLIGNYRGGGGGGIGGLINSNGSGGGNNGSSIGGNGGGSGGIIGAKL